MYMYLELEALKHYFQFQDKWDFSPVVFHILNRVGNTYQDIISYFSNIWGNLGLPLQQGNVFVRPCSYSGLNLKKTASTNAFLGADFSSVSGANCTGSESYA